MNVAEAMCTALVELPLQASVTLGEEPLEDLCAGVPRR